MTVPPPPAVPETVSEKVTGQPPDWPSRRPGREPGVAELPLSCGRSGPRSDGGVPVTPGRGPAPLSPQRVPTSGAEADVSGRAQRFRWSGARGARGVETCLAPGVPGCEAAARPPAGRGAGSCGQFASWCFG